MTNNTIKKKIKNAIEMKEVYDRIPVSVSNIKLRGIKRTQNMIEIDKVIISIDNPLDIYLCDILEPLNEIEGVNIINKLIEC